MPVTSTHTMPSDRRWCSSQSLTSGPDRTDPAVQSRCPLRDESAPTGPSEVDWLEQELDEVERRLYNDVIFHRVINDFMIQGGDPTGTGSHGCQFFVTLHATQHLDGKRNVLGEVVDGMSVVDAIGKVTDRGDRPVKPVTIGSIRVARSERGGPPTDRLVWAAQGVADARHRNSPPPLSARTPILGVRKIPVADGWNTAGWRHKRLGLRQQRDTKKVEETHHG